MLPELCNVRSIGRCFAPLARPCVHVGGPVICAIWRRQIDCFSMGGCDQNQVSNPFSPKCFWPYVTSGWYQHNPPIASSRAQSVLHKCYAHDTPPPSQEGANAGRVLHVPAHCQYLAHCLESSIHADSSGHSGHCFVLWRTLAFSQGPGFSTVDIQDGGRLFRTLACCLDGDILFRPHGSQQPFYSGHSFLYSGHLHFIQDTWFSADGFFGTSCLFIQDVRWVKELFS